MARSFFETTWRGPNAGIDHATQDFGGPHSYPHEAHVHQTLKPLEVATPQLRKDGRERKQYDFADWQALCAYEAAWQTVAEVLGEDQVALLISEDAEDSPALAMQQTIARKLVAVSGYHVAADRKTGELTPPSFEAVDLILSSALASGNPVEYLDTLAANQAIQTLSS